MNVWIILLVGLLSMGTPSFAETAPVDDGALPSPVAPPPELPKELAEKAKVNDAIQRSRPRKRKLKKAPGEMRVPLENEGK